MKPVIALVGRPNVGKSTLFNRLTKSRDALVADIPGLTRDRHYGHGRVGARPFLVIDTGGFEPDAKSGIVGEMAKQASQANAEADVVIFCGGISAELEGEAVGRSCAETDFVEQVEDPDDRRKKYLELTPVGAEVIGLHPVSWTPR